MLSIYAVELWAEVALTPDAVKIVTYDVKIDEHINSEKLMLKLY